MSSSGEVIGGLELIFTRGVAGRISDKGSSVSFGMVSDFEFETDVSDSSRIASGLNIGGAVTAHSMQYPLC